MILDLPDVEYFARPELSASTCKTILKPGGPARVEWLTEHEQPHRKVFDMGHAAHSLVLDVGDPVEAIPSELLGVSGSANTRAAREWIAEARKRGVTPLSPGDYATVHGMAEALSSHPIYSELRSSVREVVLTGEVYGVPFRGKLDAMHEHGALDYKTTFQYADPDNFGRQAAKYGYHIQDVAYRHLMRANGVKEPSFKFVVQEKEAPYLVSACELDDEALALGEVQLERACRIWRECMERDQWPGYATETQLVGLPLWAFDGMEDED